MASLNDLLNDFRNEIGSDFVSTDVFGEDGLSIAGISADPDFDNDSASARFAMVMKLAARVSDKLDLGAVDDNLITTDQLFILSRALGDGSYTWGVAVSNEATLGVLQMLMGEYAPQLWDAIPR